MKKALFIGDMFTRTIFTKTIGFTLIASLGAAFADIADALVLGVRLGEDGLAAVSFVIPIFMFYNLLSFGIGTGGAISYAKLLGAGKANEAVAHFNEMLWTALITGVVITVCGIGLLPQIVEILGVSPSAGAVYTMTYEYAEMLLLAAPVFFLHSLLLAFVRADDGARIASVAFVVGSVIDIALNFLLVFQFDMGVTGAALATIIGTIIGVVVCLWYVRRKYTVLNYKPCKLNFKAILSSLGTGLSTSTQNVWTLVFFIVINNLLMRLGSISAVAVFDVTLNVSFLALAVFTSMGETLQPMVATFMGERNQKAIKDTLQLSLRWGLLLGLLGIAALWIFTAPLCALFGIGADIAGEYGVFAVRCYLSGAVFAGLNIVFMDYYQAVNREKLAFTISFLRGFALLLPLAFVCGKLFRVQGIWIMFPLTELLTLCVTLLLATQMHKWLPPAKATVPTKTWLLDANVESIVPVLSEAEEFVESLDATPRQAMRVVLMIEELCTAIIQVGFAKAQGCIQVTLLRVEDGSFELHIRDNALSFNLFSAKTQRISSVDDVNEDTLNSLPLLLIRKNAKSHFYRRYQGFNTLSLTIGD